MPKTSSNKINVSEYVCNILEAQLREGLTLSHTIDRIKENEDIQKSLQSLVDSKSQAKAKTAYHFFGECMRDEMKRDNPEIKMDDIKKAVSDRWKIVKEDPVLHQKYIDMTDKAKAQKNKIPKNKSSYQFFCDDERSVLKEKHPEASFGGISKMLGDKWKLVKDETSEDQSLKDLYCKYKSMADADKLRYEEMKKKSENGESGEDSDSLIITPPAKLVKKRKVKDAKVVEKKVENEELVGDNYSNYLMKMVSKNKGKLTIPQVTKKAEKSWEGMDDDDKATYA